MIVTKETSTELLFTDLGTLDYKAVLFAQYQLLNDVVLRGTPNTVLMVEHNPVVSIGRMGSIKDVVNRDILQEKNIPVAYADRGGKTTYHGPGQLVLYPIINLGKIKKDMHYYIETLECFMLEFFDRFSLDASTTQNNRGIWIDGKKIASLGIAVKKWVSYHGISLNIDMSVDTFSHIKVCGVNSQKMTTLALEAGRSVSIGESKRVAESVFREVFDKAYGSFCRI